MYGRILINPVAMFSKKELKIYTFEHAEKLKTFIVCSNLQK